MHCLLDAKDTSLDQLPVGLIAGLVRDSQSLLPSVNGGAHVLTDPLWTDQPPLIEQFNIARGIDLAHEVKASSRNRQPLSLKVWDQAAQLFGQPWTVAAITYLCWRLPIHARGGGSASDTSAQRWVPWPAHHQCC